MAPRTVPRKQEREEPDSGPDPEDGRRDSFWRRGIEWGYIAAAVLALGFLAGVQLTLFQQVVSATALVAIALLLNRKAESELISLTLIFMSLFATCRYGYWRVYTVANYLGDSVNHVSSFDALFILTLASAECYAFLILLLGYVQSIRPLRRPPAELPEDATLWPEVDLLIPTYNEPLEVVRYTALAALNIDWPPGKLHVAILDDGHREEFRTFALEAGIGYMTRNDNRGAKAGNINRALAKTHAPYVAIFDSDHVPTRSFLQVTMGWFLRDRKLAMLQTPHHFYSPDPFERNLSQFRTVPNEGELFYGIVQDGNDFWNASFFCGSCAVLSRRALDEIGGIATETVTEDAHTSLRLQMQGWNTAYINIPQAAGLATESLSGHIKQRVRWARGMVQILRVDNPLFARGLKLPQRLCYFNAMMHFMYAGPRLIFLTAPLLYLIFSRSNIPGQWGAILAFALPYLVLTSLANSRIQGRHRHSFWNEVYETVLAPYILLPTLLAMVNPRLGSFNVTAKGGVVKHSFFDHRTALPAMVLLGLNLLGLLMAIPRLVHIPGLAWLWDGTHPGTVAMNCLWTVFNIVILGVATAVAREAQQRREHVRVAVAAQASLILPDGTIIPGTTVDFSNGGVALTLVEQVDLGLGLAVKLLFPMGRRNIVLPATVRGGEENELRLQFEELTLLEEEALTTLLYSRADSWLDWSENREADNPLRSLWRIARLSLSGIMIALSIFLPRRKRKSAGSRITANHLAPLLLLVLGLHAACTARAATGHPPQAGEGSSDSRQLFHEQFTLREIGIAKPIEFYSLHSYASVDFSLPATEIAQKARMQLAYRFAPGLIARASYLRLLLNGTPVFTLPAPPSGDSAIPLERTVELPAELLVRNNHLTFEFSGESAAQCSHTSSPAPWSSIELETTIEVFGDRLKIADDLAQLPVPFFDPASSRAVTIPVVFAATPSPGALQAAGVLASHFGVVANDRSVQFPVSVGTIPTGNALLLAENAAQLPANLDIRDGKWPVIAIRTNPVDPWSKVLVIAGGTSEQLLAAAQALASGKVTLRGATTFLADADLSLPPPRMTDDAPRWISTETPIPLTQYIAGPAAGDSSAPFNLYLRIPPDLYYANRPHFRMVLDYRYDQIPRTGASSLQIIMNRFFVGSVLLPPGRMAAKTAHSEIDLPATALRPFSNSLSLALGIAPMRGDWCHTAPPVKVAFLESSSLDLRGIPHWTALPNLELFANAGFPFTRFADLKQTTVVLPPAPTHAEMELYLMLMGHFGAQTGYPALRVSVANSDALADGSGQDFLVIRGAGDAMEIAGMSPWGPAPPEQDGISISAADLRASLNGAWSKLHGNSTDPSKAALAFGEPDAMLEGLESPYAPGHSVVVVTLKDNLPAAPLAEAFLKVSQSSTISGAVSVFSEGQFHSYRLSDGIYHLGALPWQLQLDRRLMQAPWIMPLVALVFCLLLAAFVRRRLDRRAGRRLGRCGN